MNYIFFLSFFFSLIFVSFLFLLLKTTALTISEIINNKNNKKSNSIIEEKIKFNIQQQQKSAGFRSGVSHVILSHSFGILCVDE